MRPTIRLGRIAGIPIGMHWGVLVIVLLIAGSLAVGTLPGLYPGFGPVGYALAGMIAALLFIASLLTHELAHALVAKAYRIRVESITLWLLGGVAQLRDEPRSPRIDFLVAAAGPATSVLLGGGFGAVAVALAASGVTGLVVAVPAYLAAVNLLLAVFNLVPAAPLDGGRVLRAALWAWRGDRTWAAVVAARAGRLFGYALIVLGIAQILLLSQFGGLWLALIGWFLVNAASAEAVQATTTHRLAGVRVGDVMTPQPMTADGTQTVAQFVDEVALRRMFSSYPLVDADRRLTGLVTLNRIRSVPPERRFDTRLADIACPPGEVPPATVDMPITELLPQLATCTDGRAVVTDPTGHVIGVVSPTDVARAMSLADLRAADPYLARGADLRPPPGPDHPNRPPERPDRQESTRWAG
jgi:Zn-dependent protease/CBS domain-containing protein